MDTLIEKFPAQLKEAMEIGEAASITKHPEPIHKVYVAGMGGSGIGGDFVAEFIAGECKVPYIVGKSYDVPAYIDKNTLAIVSSYSGNTEETLFAFDQLINTGAKIICIASGGQLLQKAESLHLDCVKIPTDWPSPRACLGYSLVMQLHVLNKLHMIGNGLLHDIKASIDLIKYDQDEIRKIAKEVAQKVYGKTLVIYTTDRMESVAVRFRQQVNENAKLLCWHHVIPEMNHNELVGWKDKRSDLAVLYFRNKDDFKRNAIRININQEIIGKLVPTIVELYSKGKSLVEKSMYFVHLGDWVSWYLSEMHQVDAIEVNVIDYLKKELSKM